MEKAILAADARFELGRQLFLGRPFRIFPKEKIIDAVGRLSNKWRGRVGKKPDRPQIGIKVKPDPKRSADKARFRAIRFS